MTEQQQADALSDAVKSLPHTGDPERGVLGDPEFDHLVDEIQHPETEEALYEMAWKRPVK